MRRKAFTWWELVIVLGFLMIAAAVLFPIFGHHEPTRIHSSCRSNLKQISLGFKQYIQDYDEKFPILKSDQQSWPVRKGQAGWMDILQPYLKSTQIFQCAADKSGYINGNTDYFYNARLIGQQERKLDFISNTILMGDGVPDSPSNISLSQFPAEWVSDANSPAFRHLEGANYSYADGHVKWLKPTAVTNEKASGSVTTFAPW